MTKRTKAAFITAGILLWMTFILAAVATIANARAKAVVRDNTVQAETIAHVVLQGMGEGFVTEPFVLEVQGGGQTITVEHTDLQTCLDKGVYAAVVSDSSLVSITCTSTTTARTIALI